MYRTRKVKHHHNRKRSPKSFQTASHGRHFGQIRAVRQLQGQRQICPDPERNLRAEGLRGDAPTLGEHIYARFQVNFCTRWLHLLICVNHRFCHHDTIDKLEALSIFNLNAMIHLRICYIIQERLRKKKTVRYNIHYPAYAIFSI